MDKKNKIIEAELDYKDIAKNPIRAFPVIFIYFFAVALGLGIYFANKLDPISFNRIPGTSLDTLDVVRDIEFKKGGIKPAVDLSVLLNPPADLMANGEKVFESTCASCHGAEGRGDGAASAALDPKPRNFHVADGWTNGRSFYDLYKTVNNGIPGTGMTAFEYLPPIDRIAAILYLRTFAEFPEINDKIISKVDGEFNLSKGVVEPNQIPVRSAINNISDENIKQTELVRKNLESSLLSKSTGMTIVKQNSFNYKKSVSIFALNFKNIKDINEFVSIISYSPEQYGFKPSVLNLTSQQWNSLFSFLRSISSKVNRG